MQASSVAAHAASPSPGVAWPLIETQSRRKGQACEQHTPHVWRPAQLSCPLPPPVSANIMPTSGVVIHAVDPLLVSLQGLVGGGAAQAPHLDGAVKGGRCKGVGVLQAGGRGENPVGENREWEQFMPSSFLEVGWLAGWLAGVRARSQALLRTVFNNHHNWGAATWRASLVKPVKPNTRSSLAVPAGTRLSPPSPC